MVFSNGNNVRIYARLLSAAASAFLCSLNLHLCSCSGAHVTQIRRTSAANGTAGIVIASRSLIRIRSLNSILVPFYLSAVYLRLRSERIRAAGAHCQLDWIRLSFFSDRCLCQFSQFTFHSIFYGADAMVFHSIVYFVKNRVPHNVGIKSGKFANSFNMNMLCGDWDQFWVIEEGQIELGTFFTYLSEDDIF